jgi:hypothetical protein
MNKWPKQSAAEQFYGNPSAADFERRNIVNVSVPWMMVTAWDGKQVKNIRVHHKCAQSLGRILAVIWSIAGKSQDVINKWGLNKYGGGYAFRPMRGGRSLSMHAFGCAVDFDPERNPLGGQHPHFAECPIVLEAFATEGWTWGGSWQRRDGMHWQAARVG